MALNAGLMLLPRQLRELVDADNSQAFHNRVQAAISKQHGEELVRIESVNRNIIRQLEVQHHLLKKLARKLSVCCQMFEDISY